MQVEGLQYGPQGPSINSCPAICRHASNSDIEPPADDCNQVIRPPHVKLPALSLAMASHTSLVQEEHPQKLFDGLIDDTGELVGFKSIR